MAKGKSSKGTKYTSKGERANVARNVVNIGRRERKAHPTVESMIASSTHRNSVIARSKDKNIAALRSKYLEEEKVKNRADALFKKYGSKGATWAACVQAVKTDWISNFEHKWSDS